MDSELIRIGNPPRYGGLDVGYETAFEIAWELGRACGATAWCYALWTVHNWWVGHFPVEAQDEFFANGPNVLASSALNPTRGQAKPVSGGYRLTGRWQFSSGCDAASWVMVASQQSSGLLWLLLPRSDYQIIDTWFTSGMRGTGSKDIEINDVFVPAHRTLDPGRAGDGEWTGWEHHQRVSYRLPLRCLTGWDLVAPIVGMAQGMVDAFAEHFQGTSGPGRTADSVLVQVRLAEAAVEVDAARELHRRTIDDMLKKAAQGEAFSPLERARYMRNKTFVAKLCVQAVNRLFDASGGSAISETSPLQRFHRDVHAASHHQGINWDAAAENFGRQTLGLEPMPGRYGLG
jgi:3-hydroxy-9,10-secoandrosta-1,3,5(10)-triene-9,17-dione monooxygenase